jgi:hypothetical protein
MDEHDRYIEDSNALMSLVKRYPKELEEVFGKIAHERNEWWLLPAEAITDQAWEQMLGLTGRGGINSEDATRDVVRVWQRHHKKAPEGWSEMVRANILAGRQGELAIKHGWFGKTEDHEMDKAIKTGLHHSTINALNTARHVSDNNINISPESWRGLIMKGSDALFYAPLDVIDQDLVRKLISDTSKSSHSIRGFLADFYVKFKQLRDIDDEPNATRSSPTPGWSKEGLLRARKLAGMITMDDIIAAVIKYPDSLAQFKMDFGMKPWLAAAGEALKHAGSHTPGKTVQGFLHRASTVIRHNDDEPWAQQGGDLMNLVHQILAQHPEEAQSIFRYPEGEMPMDTQNAIINNIVRQVDPVARARAAQRLGTAMDAGYFSSEAEEILRAIEKDGDIDSLKYERLRRAVPAQQQIEMPVQQQVEMTP